MESGLDWDTSIKYLTYLTHIDRSLYSYRTIQCMHVLWTLFTVRGSCYRRMFPILKQAYRSVKRPHHPIVPRYSLGAFFILHLLKYLRIIAIQHRTHRNTCNIFLTGIQCITHIVEYTLCDSFSLDVYETMQCGSNVPFIQCSQTSW